jgi:hypothetical protein
VYTRGLWDAVSDMMMQDLLMRISRTDGERFCCIQHDSQLSEKD